ncbi:type II toxin-antitoxin system VapC family toxin [Cerasicoccus frondis]|uniref:type II toxin-antitoxin system VapC family toxin n=1 Tax=Cerasicoccus frondis TaxID=490090 RepID=UPI00285286AA|nr:type II toxin-antitoxin system VapC family toxin [Cerasicoccus frondis]
MKSTAKLILHPSAIEDLYFGAASKELVAIEEALGEGMKAFVPESFMTRLIQAFLDRAGRGELTESELNDELAEIDYLPIEIEPTVPYPRQDILKIAQGHHLPANDAVYLYLAQKEKGLLVATNGQVLEAARSMKVKIFTEL